jgi:hypothetical protein
MSAISSVTSLSNPYNLQALLGTSASGASAASNGSSSAAGTGGVTASLSGPGQLLSALQQLQTQDPSQFSQVVGQIATQVQAAAQQQGQSGAGQFLTSLAGKLQNVATTGDLSQLESHHGHHGHHAQGTYNSQGQAVAPTATSGSQTDSSNNIQQLFANIVQEVQQAAGT